MRNEALEEQQRRYRVKAKAPFNKKVTLFSFELSHTNNSNFSKIDLIKKELNTSTILTLENLSGKVRKLEEIKYKDKNSLYLFISLYDKTLDVSTTNENANDNITAETVNNADHKHIFLKVTEENIWAFSTISAGYLYQTLARLFEQVLPVGYMFTQTINKDIAQIIRDEKVENLTLITGVDPLALGFPKSCLIERFFAKTENSTSPYARVILDRKLHLTMMEAIESSPTEAIECLSQDQATLSGDIYLVTKTGRKIKGEDLKLNKICYLEPFGKTKTVSWSDAVDLLKNIEKELLYFGE